MPVDIDLAAEVDVHILVRWLGADGARAGLDKSKRCTADTLMKVAERLGAVLPKSATRAQMIHEIVRVANRRIDKPIEQLFRMSRDEIVHYLEKVEPDREELLDLLKGIEASPSKEGRQGLIELAARELSETGRFMRIASPGSTDSDRAKSQATRKKNEAL